jgi:hypothetical protein
MLISALKSIFTAFIDLIIISLNIISTIANQWEIITTIELFFYLRKKIENWFSPNHTFTEGTGFI